jgi:hypothetical protein
MGEALEGLGRRAEAAAVYDRLAAEPLPSTAHPLFVTAQETARARLKVLSAKLPSLLIKIAGVPADAATVTVDGRPFDSGADVAVRMDPGDHRVRVSAPERLPFDEIVALEEGAGVVIVTARMRKPGQPESDDPFVETVPPPDDGIAPPPVTSWVLLGVGTAALVAGGVTGGIALSKAGDLEERCPDRRCPPSAEPDHEEAEIFGWTSTVALGVGVAAVAAAAVVWFVDMGDEADTARLQLGPGTIGARVRF